MKQRMTETRGNDGVKNTRRRAAGGAMASLIAATSVAGCVAPEVSKTPTETVSTPEAGQALPIGLLNEEKISSLPDGEVKNSLQTEFSSAKAECVSIPGCMGNTVRIFRVIVPDDVYFIRFADFKTENEAEHTEILSMMDGKTPETTKIQKDLLAKEAVIDGVQTKAFGYVDDLGNSHYVFVDQGENKYLFDADQNPYKVVTQNEKEVQAYSSFWSDPMIADAAPLPTPTAGIVPSETTPTQEVTPTAEAVKYPEFSKFFQPEFKENYVAEIYGMEIPVDIGLSHWVVARPDNPIKEIHIAEDIVPILAEDYLISCHYRFTHMMSGNENVTYEQYIELVKEGKGNIDMAVFDEGKESLSRFPEVMSIDPRKGFALTFTDGPLPIKINDIADVYYGEINNKLMIGYNVSSSFVANTIKAFSSEREGALGANLFLPLFQNSLIGISTFEDKCLLLANVKSSCGYPVAPEEVVDIIYGGDYVAEYIKFRNGERGPLVEIKQ